MYIPIYQCSACVYRSMYKNLSLQGRFLGSVQRSHRDNNWSGSVQEKEGGDERNKK